MVQVYLVKQMMQQEGCDMMLDVHGDEELPYNFISGNEGIPSWNPRLAHLQVVIEVKVIARVTLRLYESTRHFMP